MRFIIKGPLKDNPYNLARKLGYKFLSEDKGEMNLVRNLGPNYYPRFHIYLKIENNDLIFNLHLDQKKPSYKGATAHSGEYDTELTKKEAQRIKSII
jgi:hypothetical protein